MPFRKILVFFLIPVIISLAIMAMHFSGIDRLMQIVVPDIPWMNSDSVRELGLLENIQNIYLLAMIATAIYGIKIKPMKWERLLMAFLALGAIFVFLEEIDYGLHYYDYLMKIGPSSAGAGAEIRNIHNIGEVTDFLKFIMNAGIALLFVIAPLTLAKSSNSLIRYITPGRWFILTVVSMFLLSRLAHALNRAGFGSGTLDNNISEFSEMTDYYIFMIYFYELVFGKSGHRLSGHK